jgi:hypothetical protein
MAMRREWVERLVLAKHGHLYCRKDAKNLGQCSFLSAREIEHGRFRALFAGKFALRCRMVEFHPKIEKFEFPTRKLKGRQRHGS